MWRLIDRVWNEWWWRWSTKRNRHYHHPRARVPSRPRAHGVGGVGLVGWLSAAHHPIISCNIVRQHIKSSSFTSGITIYRLLISSAGEFLHVWTYHNGFSSRFEICVKSTQWWSSDFMAGQVSTGGWGSHRVVADPTERIRMVEGSGLNSLYSGKQSSYQVLPPQPTFQGRPSQSTIPSALGPWKLQLKLSHHFVGIIQLLCNPDGCSFKYNLSCRFRAFNFKKCSIND